MVQEILKKIGFSEDETRVYLNMLENSPTSVRTIAAQTGIGRGSVFNILKKLVGEGVVSYYRKGKAKLFMVKDPEALIHIFERRQQVLQENKKEVKDIIPELRSFYRAGDKKPNSRYFEGTKEISQILWDVLETMSEAKKKEYFVYSTVGERKIIYKDFPDFSKQRIERKIKVKVIAIGEGGELRGLDQRKWLGRKKNGGDSSYVMIYGDKVAFVTIDDSTGEPQGVILEDKASAETQKTIFKKLWSVL